LCHTVSCKTVKYERVSALCKQRDVKLPYRSTRCIPFIIYLQSGTNRNVSTIGDKYSNKVPSYLTATLSPNISGTCCHFDYTVLLIFTGFAHIYFSAARVKFTKLSPKKMYITLYPQ